MQHKLVQLDRRIGGTGRRHIEELPLQSPVHSHLPTLKDYLIYFLKDHNSHFYKLDLLQLVQTQIEIQHNNSSAIVMVIPFVGFFKSTQKCSSKFIKQILKAGL